MLEYSNKRSYRYFFFKMFFRFFVSLFIPRLYVGKEEAVDAANADEDEQKTTTYLNKQNLVSHTLSFSLPLSHHLYPFSLSPSLLLSLSMSVLQKGIFGGKGMFYFAYGDYVHKRGKKVKIVK